MPSFSQEEYQGFKKSEVPRVSHQKKDLHFLHIFHAHDRRSNQQRAEKTRHVFDGGEKADVCVVSQNRVAQHFER